MEAEARLLLFLASGCLYSLLWECVSYQSGSKKRAYSRIVSVVSLDVLLYVLGLPLSGDPIVECFAFVGVLITFELGVLILVRNIQMATKGNPPMMVVPEEVL